MPNYVAWYSTYGMPDIGVPYVTAVAVDWAMQQQIGELLAPAPGCRFNYCEEDHPDAQA